MYPSEFLFDLIQECKQAFFLTIWKMGLLLRSLYSGYIIRVKGGSCSSQKTLEGALPFLRQA